jgi:anti-sigma factor RsiW
MKNCEDISKGLIAYLDQRANPAERRDVEAHIASCAACRTRAEEFRALWKAMEEVPAVEPSLGFNARVRQRVAAEPRTSWFGWFEPQARLALSAALLVALTVFMVKLPANHPQAPVPAPTATASSDQDFDAVKDLGVLEDYDVVTNMDALSQLVPAKAPETQKPDSKQTESND